MVVRLVINADAGVKVCDIIDELDYDIQSQTEGADIQDTEILDYKVVDAK